MALLEKCTQEDLMLYEIMKNPVLFPEFVVNYDKLEHEEKFELTWYQKDFLGDFNQYVSICCSRAVGKTESLTWLIVWLLVMNVFPSDYILYTVPNKVHLEPVFSKLIRAFRSNTFLKCFIAQASGINNSDFSIVLLNTAKLICRIAGTTGGGTNVIGLHSPFEILDEAGYYPWGTWIELQPTFNSWTYGSRVIVSGVPTGLRERNVLYTCDMENSSYTKHRINSMQNPRFTDDDRLKAEEQYGGEDTDDYIHLVLGQHGKPVFSIFDRNQMEISNYPVYKLILNGTQMSEDLTDYINKLSMLPPLPEGVNKSILGIDLGYTEPTAILVLYLDKFSRIKFHAKLKLEKVSYNIQDRFIDAIDTKFRPSLIGIDASGVGKGPVQRLLEATEFAHKDYQKKLVPVDFSSRTTIGKDSNGEDITSKTKPLSVSVLQEYSNNHRIIYTTTDLEMIAELERMTYTKSVTGEIVYKTLTERGGKRGEDHFTSALLCASLAYYIKNEILDFTRQRKKLASSNWYVGF